MSYFCKFKIFRVFGTSERTAPRRFRSSKKTVQDSKSKIPMVAKAHGSRTQRSRGQYSYSIATNIPMFQTPIVQRSVVPKALSNIPMRPYSAAHRLLKVAHRCPPRVNEVSPVRAGSAGDCHQRLVSPASKPLVLGETFRCVWLLPSGRPRCGLPLGSAAGR